MALISGARATDSPVSDRRKYDVSDQLWEVDPDYAVMTFFARKLNKKRVTDPEYRWFDKEQPSKYSAIDYSTGYTSGDTQVVVDSGQGTRFRPGDIVQVIDSGEQVRVTGVSTDTLTVTRGFGTTSATTINDNDSLVILGNAHEEGASSREALTSQAVKRYNYTQIFREPIEVTGSEDSTEFYAGGNDLAQLRREHLQIHHKDLERSFIFGERNEDTSTGTHPIRSTGGLNSFLTTNLKDAGGSLTESEFEDWISDVFQNGGDKKMGFLSPLVASAVNSWAKSALQMYPKDKTYGIAITKYLSIHGELDFVVQKLFAENTTWNGYAFAVDMSKVGYRYLGGNGKSRDTKLLKNRQANDADLVKEEYRTEAGFWLALENRHGVLYGVTGYA